MGNSNSKTKTKKKEKQIIEENILKEQLYQIETNKLPSENDAPNNKYEYEILIKGYLNDHINKSNQYIISQDIIGVIALFYPFQFIVEQKALKMSRKKKLKDGVKYLLKHYDANNMNIDDNNKPKYIAKYLYYKHPYLDQEEIGEFMSNLESICFNEEGHKQLLLHYFEYIDFYNLSFLNAFKKLLNSGFCLPREAQKIDRLLDRFSIHYYESNKDNKNNKLASSDDILLLSYSVLMLNTELHNHKAIQADRASMANFNRMTKESFRNLTGDNIPTEIADDIYDYISKHSIFTRGH